MPHDLPNDLKLRISGDYEISGNSQNCIELLLSAYSSSRNDFFVSTSKNLIKNRNWTFPVVRYCTWRSRVFLTYCVNDCRYLWNKNRKRCFSSKGLHPRVTYEHFLSTWLCLRKSYSGKRLVQAISNSFLNKTFCAHHTMSKLRMNFLIFSNVFRDGPQMFL